MLRQALTEEARRDVAGTFSFRARGEREAHLRFTRLAVELFTTGASDLVVRLAKEAAEDEARHALVCDRIATEWGMPSGPVPVTATPVGPRTLPPHERVLVEMVSLCCVAETIANLVLRASLETVREPSLKDALHEIAKDEVKHARLGWAHLAEARRKGHGEGLAALLPSVLDAGLPEALFAALPTSADCPELGTLSEARRKELVVAAFLEVVFPGFEALDVDPGPSRAWLASRRDLATDARAGS